MLRSKSKLPLLHVNLTVRVLLMAIKMVRIWELVVKNLSIRLLKDLQAKVIDHRLVIRNEMRMFWKKKTSNLPMILNLSKS